MIYIIGNDGTPQRVDGVGNELYPVGSIYMSTENTSPASMFGGTWEQIKDCFLWATGDTTSITYTQNGVSVTRSLTAGSRAGELTHKLTVNEMPSHTHNLRSVTDNSPITRWATSTGGDNYVGVIASNNTYNYGSKLIYNEDTGGSQAHNNMPPYLAVYCWKRIS